MESLSVRHLISAATQNIFPKIRRYQQQSNPIINNGRRVGIQTTHILLSSKKSDFQDFQDYAKPSRLLQATEVEVCTDNQLLEKTVSSFKERQSKSLYKVKLLTSNTYGSGLSDLNAGILLCLVDENGDSILQRIPASLIKDRSTQSKDEFVSEEFHFHRGSVDEFFFEGPKLGNIEAVWISLESGQWRLGGVSLTVISPSQPPIAEDSGESNQYMSYQYEFEADDILLGEGSEMSMAELRPRLVTELSGNNFSLWTQNISPSTSFTSRSTSNKESMREYEDLKLSLLLYDAVLVLAGSSISSFSIGESAGFAFLIGGFAGLLYLLLLQRSVDELPAPRSTSMNGSENIDQSLGKFNGPVVISVVLGLAASVIALKYGLRDGENMLLTPKDLLLGMMGFLACKVAVVLAAFKPMPRSVEDNK